MMCLSLEAGLDFTSAIARIADQIRGHPMGRALHRLLADLRLGRSRVESLRRFRDDLNLTAATRLVSLLIQAEMLGAPVAQLLREESRCLRFERFQTAERMGVIAAQKLLFPLIFCIMPVVFLVVFGPLWVQVATQGLDGVLGGGR
jgi:tight adherence protein C